MYVSKEFTPATPAAAKKPERIRGHCRYLCTSFPHEKQMRSFALGAPVAKSFYFDSKCNLSEYSSSLSVIIQLCLKLKRRRGRRVTRGRKSDPSFNTKYIPTSTEFLLIELLKRKKKRHQTCYRAYRNIV